MSEENVMVTSKEVALQEHLGYTIYVTQDGKFTVTLPGRKVIERSNLNDVRREIDKTKQPVDVVTVDDLDSIRVSAYVPNQPQITRASVLDRKPEPGSWYNAEKRRYLYRDEAGKWRNFSGPVYLYDQAIVDELKAIAAEEEAAMDEMKSQFVSEVHKAIGAYRDRMREVLIRATEFDPVLLRKRKAAK